jgi:ABC-2 type transport system permease protein/oleandomycin transport system permease protein
MATITTPSDLPTPEERAALPPRRVLGDIAILAERNLRRLRRNTGLIVFSTLQPLLQLILFAYVFTAVATVGGDISYKEFVVPAVLVQSMTFSAMGSGVGIAYDLQSGMINRFRVLPIARSAFLVGRTASDSLRLGIQSLMLVAASLIIGFRFQAGFWSAVGMVVVIVLFGIALTAFSAWLGLAIGDPETVQPAVFIPVLPLVFTSSAFAPVDQLPEWMQPLANINPITAAIDAARGLALGSDTLEAISNVTLTQALIEFAIWWVAIVSVFTWLAVRRYRRG